MAALIFYNNKISSSDCQSKCKISKDVSLFGDRSYLMNNNENQLYYEGYFKGKEETQSFTVYLRMALLTFSEVKTVKSLSIHVTVSQKLFRTFRFKDTDFEYEEARKLCDYEDNLKTSVFLMKEIVFNANSNTVDSDLAEIRFLIYHNESNIQLLDKNNVALDSS